MYSERSSTSLQLIQPTFAEIDLRNIELLNRHFSTKTMFGAELNCKEEAKHILQASLRDATIQQAVLSLRSFRRDFETSDNNLSSPVGQHSSQPLGLQRYIAAIRGLASNLSSEASNKPHLTLLCCQLFISIEHVRGNYDAMAQHIIQGLRIMRECRPRPILVAAHTLVPAQQDHVPLLDVFVIKLFVAPCKFAQPPSRVNHGEPIFSDRMTSVHQQQPIDARNSRAIAHDTRTELKKIAIKILEFLDLMSALTSHEDAVQLVSDKETLLESLRSWLADLELAQTKRWPGSESISTSLMRLFHCILKVVLLSSLESSADLDAQVRTENNRLYRIASHVTERLKAYRMQVPN